MDFGELEEPAGTMCKAEPQQSISRATARRLAVSLGSGGGKTKLGAVSGWGTKCPPLPPRLLLAYWLMFFVIKHYWKEGRLHSWAPQRRNSVILSCRESDFLSCVMTLKPILM